MIAVMMPNTRITFFDQLMTSQNENHSQNRELKVYIQKPLSRRKYN